MPFTTEQIPLLKQDAEDFSTEVNEGGSDRSQNKKGEVANTLTTEILEERRERLRKQNRKLDFELRKQEEKYGDLEEMRRDVQRMNRVVMQSLKSMAGRIAEPLAGMTDPREIKAFLLEQLAEVFQDLAEHHGSRS